MNNIESNLLLVEGEGDKFFFDKLLKKNNFFDFHIDVLTPKDMNSTYNGKRNVITELKSYAKERENNKFSNKKLACIIDADYIKNDRTIFQELKSLKTELSQYSYDDYEQHKTGYYFKSNHVDLRDKGFHNIGIWFMPNNKDEGMLEDWFLKIAKDSETILIDYADKVCQKAPEIRFNKDKDSAKAQVGVWTALQKSPHLGTENIILQNLYNENSLEFQNFITWLNFIFQSPKTENNILQSTRPKLLKLS